MTLFILTLFQTGYKLRISTLYHLLVGKRTSSVLLHGFFYENLAYLGSLPNLTEALFQKAVKELEVSRLITVEEGFGVLTQQGKLRLAENYFDLSGLNNLRYGRMRENSWQLLLFALQVVSHLSFKEKNYVPIENRPYYLQQVKKWLAQSGPELAARIQAELIENLQQLPSDVADFLANQFSGHEFQGKTVFQLLPEKWQKEPWSILYWQRAIDLFLAQNQKGELARLIAALDQQNFNQSMLKTRALFLSGKTVDAILKERHLKQGTINDHFIEWALLAEDFPFDRFEKLSFENLDENQVIHEQYQEYEVPYLTFRLSQIYYLRKRQWI